MNIYVSNVNWNATETDLEAHFRSYGPVVSVTINLHQSGHHKGKSDGTGIVVMENQEDGERAIQALDGQDFMDRPLKVNPARPRGGREQRRRKRPDQQKDSPSNEMGATDDEHDYFHNPYTFVPTPPRPADGFAGDYDPLKNDLDHASLKDNLWTGHIPIKLTTVTPLVLLKTDGEDRSTDTHQTYDVLDYLPETSLRGMLRSAYEVVTNSRYTCFGNEHQERLAYRMDSGDAPQLIPAIIKNGNKPGQLVAQLCTGTSVPTAIGPKTDGTDQEGAVYAAMFNPYDDTEQRTKYDSDYTPKTGDEVWAQIVLCQHRRGYLYWKALKVWWTDKYPNRPPEADLVDPIDNPIIEVVVKGHVLITNKNIKDKRDERIFFTLMADMFDVTADLNKIQENKENILKTGDKVWAEIVLYQHEVSPEGEKNWFEDFLLFWKVVKVWSKEENSEAPEPTGETPENSTEPETNTDERQSYYSPVSPKSSRVVEMDVSITSENIGNTHNKRIFLTESMSDITHLKTDWEKLIKNYRDAHTKKDIFHRKDRRGNPVKPWDKFGDKPGETAWSPHLYQDSDHLSIWHNNDPHGRDTDHDAFELKHGDLVYARCEFKNGKISKITHLVPVSISRMLYDRSPQALLPCSLRPAKRRSELSPADRLFGWVVQPDGEDPDEADQAKEQSQEREPYKGRIRVVCDDRPRPNIIERFEDDQTLPLTILGQPKPEQARFYVAKDKTGTPEKDGIKKWDADYGYSKDKGLRGRKQYWHHKGLEAHRQADKPARDYWKATVEDRTKVKRDGRYQEYRRPDKCPKENRNNGWQQKDSQNRSITGWIKPGKEFRASLYVQNLQDAEVGALLWLLSRSEGHYFRLGYGKPLGFGSVRMEIDCPDKPLPLGTGEHWKEYYATFDTSLPETLNKLNKEQQNKCRQKFQKSMAKAYSEVSDNDTTEDNGDGSKTSNLKQSFENLFFIKEFLQILKGPETGLPIHYPRTNQEQDPEGKNFAWFSRNEGSRGSKLALPAATEDNGLPYEP